MTYRRLATCLLLALGASPLSAQAACPAPYVIDDLLNDLMTVETGLRTGDDVNAAKGALQLEAGLGCMDTVLPRAISGRALRAVGAGLAVGEQADRANGWLVTAVEVEQAFDFGLEDLPEGHPVRASYAQARTQAGGEEVVVPGAFAGTGYLDGRKLTEPKARDGRQHLLQVDTGAGVRSWIVTGHQFPADALVAAPVAVAEEEGGRPPKPEKPPKPPKEPKGEEPAVVQAPRPAPAPKEPKPTRPAPAPASNAGIVEGVRNRPPEKTPLMIGGAAIAFGGGGVLYYLAAQNKADFNSEETSPDAVSSAWKDARLFTIAYLSVAAVGAGTFTWGAIVSGEGTPLPALHVRF